MKTKVSIILVCLIWMASSAYATVYNGVCGEHLTWTYDTETGDMIIEGYGKLEKTVDSLWWNSPVVQIAQYSNNYKATSPKRVILPEGVTSICSGAFSNFALMTECNIPDGVTKIGSSAFSGCSKLKHMFLPNSVDTIGASAFNECKALDSLDCGKGVKYIGGQAFFNCDNLDYLRWSDSLEYLGRLAFDGMSEQGGSYYHAFPDTLFFPVTLRSNEQLSWASMYRLKAIVWNVRKLDTQSTTGYGHILYNPYTSYKEIIFGPDVEEIPDYFMVNQKAITRILLPEGTRKIGNSAFSGCAKIEEIVLPSTLETIDPLAFQGCLAIKRADIPRNTDRIDEYKVLLPRSGNPGGIVIGRPKISEPLSCSSNTYCVVIPPNKQLSKEEAYNLLSYMKTKFFRFLVSAKTTTQSTSTNAFDFIPLQDFSHPWTDEMLYKKYNLTEEEIAFIESMIRPME